MPNITREVLLTTKAARQWQETFDQQVDAIIDTINAVDNAKEIARTTETLDVYHHTSVHTTIPTKRRNRVVYSNRPFEFLTFRN